ncbi:MAG: ABC transporter substrate-binding protein [Actinobacteria bacterium]|nr:ABC transporter substrate-binding protein [Actinomycetota bacterium]
MRIPRSRLLAAALALLVLPALAACGSSSGGGSTSAGSTSAGKLPAQLADGLTVGMDISYPPMEYYVDGTKPTGIDPEVAKAIADRLGVPLKLQNIGFDSLITSLQGGRVDMIVSGLKDTPERHQKINMVDYFRTTLGLIVKHGNPLHITSLASLCGHTAGQVSGTVTLTAVQNASKDCQGAPIKVLTFASNSDINLALKAGRVDANLEDFVSLSYVAKTSGGGQDYDVVPQPQLGTEYFGIGTLKSQPEVTAAVAGAFKQLLDDGTIARIYRKYDQPEAVPAQFLQNAGKD